MDLEDFEELEDTIMEIVERVGVVKPSWVAEELSVEENEVREVLEALRHRGDLARDWNGSSYHKRKSRY